MQPSSVTHPPSYIVIAERRENARAIPQITRSKPTTRPAARTALARLIVGARQRRLPIVADGECITFAESHGSETSITAHIQPVNDW